MDSSRIDDGPAVPRIALSIGAAAAIACAGVAACAGILPVTARPAAFVYADAADTTTDEFGCGSVVNPCNTIQGAIDVAHSGDTVLVVAGVYHERLRINKNLWIEGDDRDTTIVDAEATGRVVIVFAESSVTLVNLTFRNGRYAEGAGVNVSQATAELVNVAVISNTAMVEGGGLYNGFDSTLVLSRTVVAGNTSVGTMGVGGRGGGIVTLAGSTLTVEDSRIEDNSALLGGGIYNVGAADIARTGVADNHAHTGGGIWSSGILALDQVVVSDNTAESGDDADGGGIANSGEAMIETCVVTGNRARRQGGGTFNDRGSILVTNSTIRDNQAALGGGVFNAAGSSVDVDRCLLAGNEADEGGAARNHGTLIVNNSTFSANLARKSGGALHNVLGTTTLQSVTATDNVADVDGDDEGDGGGLARTGGTVETGNSLLAGNIDGSPVTVHPDCSGSFASRAHNLVGDATGATGFADTTDDLVGDAGAPIDPRLGLLADNGGPTLTHALLWGSPAADAGDDDACPPEDHRGAARPEDGDGDGDARCDIGAFERGVEVATNTPTASATSTPTASVTITPTITLTPSITPTPSETIEVTPSNTPSATQRPTRTYTPTSGPPPTNTRTPTPTRTSTLQPTDTPQATDTPEATGTVSATTEPAPEPTTATVAPSDTPDVGTGTPTGTAPPTDAATPSATATLAASDVPSPTDAPGTSIYLPFARCSRR